MMVDRFKDWIDGIGFIKTMIFGLLFLIITIYVYRANPESGPILPCVFNLKTGLKCPGCGMTRAAHSLLHLNIRESFSYNKLIPLLPAWSGIYIFMKTKGEDVTGFYKVSLSIAIIYGILRNLIV